jgi:hypothetical protein
MDYEKMSDGELDKAVAEKVMGYSLIDAEGEDWFDKIERFPVYCVWPEGGTAVYEEFSYESKAFSPSTDLVAAFTVVEKIKGLVPDGTFTMAAFQKENYAAGFMIPQPNAAPTSWHWVEAPTLPRAICECALKVMEVSADAGLQRL